MFGFSQSTVLTYLKKGDILGWCEYDPKKSWRDAHTGIIYDTRYVMTKLIIGSKEYFFLTAKEFESKSEELLGHKITSKKIIKLLNGNNNHLISDGYEIIRINKEEYLNGIRKSS